MEKNCLDKLAQLHIHRDIEVNPIGIIGKLRNNEINKMRYSIIKCLT